MTGIFDISPSRTRVLVALCVVYEREGRATMRDVAAEAGTTLSNTRERLLALAELGLVDWEPGKGGTLRPLLERVTMKDFL